MGRAERSIAHGNAHCCRAKLIRRRRQIHGATGTASAESNVGVWQQRRIGRRTGYDEVGCRGLRITDVEPDRANRAVFIGHLIGNSGNARRLILSRIAADLNTVDQDAVKDYVLARTG